MSKAVVYILTATAIFIFFIILSPKSNLEKPKGRLNRRVLERAPTFDPLVTKIEREAEKKLQPQQHVEAEANSTRVSVLGLNSTTPLSEIAETYQYLTSGGKLNTTLRLIILFPLLDREPKDGLVDFNELEAWISQQAIDRLNYVTQAELESKDKDGDLALSFKEYLGEGLSPRGNNYTITTRGIETPLKSSATTLAILFGTLGNNNIEKEETGHGEAGLKERFNIADVDHNGLLNFTELRDLLHPEDSKNQEMLKWMIRDKLKSIDMENTGKVNFSEFEDHLYSTYENYLDFENNGGDVPDAKDKFAELDVNKDRFLSPEELIPILSYIYPGELAYAKYFTCYLMNEADDDGDESLSLQEMLNHEYIFYNTVHDGHVERDDDHDEL